MLSTAAPIGGTEVLLSSDNMLLPVPAPSVTVPAGAYSATFMLTAGSTSRPQSATLMAIALNSVVLSWNPSMSSNLVSYKIYRAVTLGGPYALLKTVGLVTNYIDYDVQPSQTYYYLVRAVDDHGTESAYSNAASVVLPSQRPQTATVTFRPDVPFDFNGGGVPDLVWQNTTTSQVGVWYMGGTGGAVRQSSAWISESGVPGWTVVD